MNALEEVMDKLKDEDYISQVGLAPIIDAVEEIRWQLNANTKDF